jgi:hypothetical protein
MNPIMIDKRGVMEKLQNLRAEANGCGDKRVAGVLRIAMEMIDRLPAHEAITVKDRQLIRSLDEHFIGIEEAKRLRTEQIMKELGEYLIKNELATIECKRDPAWYNQLAVGMRCTILTTKQPDFILPEG